MNLCLKRKELYESLLQYINHMKTYNITKNTQHYTIKKQSNITLQNYITHYSPETPFTYLILLKVLSLMYSPPAVSVHGHIALRSEVAVARAPSTESAIMPLPATVMICSPGGVTPNSMLGRLVGCRDGALVGLEKGCLDGCPEGRMTG